MALSGFLALSDMLGLYLRSTNTLNQSGGLVTSWDDSSGNGNTGTPCGTVAPDYESDPLGDGSGYGTEIAETEVGGSTTGRAGLETGISFATDPARKAVTMFSAFVVRAYAGNGGVIMGFEGNEYSIYEYNSGEIRVYNGSDFGTDVSLALDTVYRLIVVSDTTANGGTKAYLNGSSIFSGVQTPASEAMDNFVVGSCNNDDSAGFYSLIGVSLCGGIYGRAFNTTDVATLDALIAEEVTGVTPSPPAVSSGINAIMMAANF